MELLKEFLTIPWNLFKLPDGLPLLNTTSIYYISFALVVFLASLIFRKRARAIVLLIADFVFLYSFGIWHFIIALSISLIAYLASFFIKKKYVLWLMILAYSPLLVVFKLGLSFSPLGISFYIFKILSYLIDVKREKIELEKNIINYLNYVLFFPCITAGPINRADKFLKELKNDKTWEYVDRKNGGFQLMYGIFEKLVFCDFVAQIVSKTLTLETTGLTLLIGVFLYSFQIYLDFDSYSNIAIGTARLVGFHIDKNFDSPYLAYNLKDFWRRWHISLSTWLRDYIYIPLGGSRKGQGRKYLNLIIVFAISALWHGFNYNYLLWGLLHALIQIVEDLFEKITHINDIKFLLPIRIVFNFVIVSFIWLVFKETNLSNVLLIFNNLFKPTSTVLLPDVTRNETVWLIVVLVTVIVTDILRTSVDIYKVFNSHKALFIIRWIVYILMIIVFLVFGVYGGGFEASDFIYRWF